jgi:tetratricopeptide (TPR) repeat protein
MTAGATEAAHDLLDAALAACPDDADVHNDLAVICSLLSGHRPVAARELTARALQFMHRAVELCPGSAFYRLNLAHMYADTGWRERAIDLVHEALPLLGNGQEEPADPFCLPFPFAWDEFRVQTSILYCATRSAPESFPAVRQCLSLHRGGMLLGKLAEEQRLPEMAALGYRVAVAARADLGSGHVALARVLARSGEAEQALAHLDAGLIADPFQLEGWTSGARLLLDRGQQRAAEAFIRERLTMLNALVPPEERLAMSAALSDLEEVRAALTGMLQGEPVPA